MERLVPDRVEEVEEPHIVRARIRAIPRADAAVVDLCIQPLVRMVAGVGRTHRLARGGVTLLTQHGPELQPRVRKLALPIAFHANPVHGPADRSLGRTNGRDVVLGPTCRHARFASRAAIEVDRHSPSVCHTLGSSTLLVEAPRHGTVSVTRRAHSYPGALALCARMLAGVSREQNQASVS